ncbi:MAG: OB-fold nucleic acid binding domain-containing protein [Candidatus Micrarchaeia archaeon]
MKISELKAGTGNVNVAGEITEKEEARDVITKFGKKLRVASAKLKDDSGEVILSLWNEDADKFALGDKVKIENGWVSEFKGNAQLSAGKFGKITKE